MSVFAFWAHSASQSAPFEFNTGDDANLVVTHIALEGPCSSTTTLSVKCSYAADYPSEDEDASVGELETEETVIAHLTWGRLESSPVNVHFGSNEKITFSVKGDGIIHMVGRFAVDDEEDQFSFDEEMSSMEDEDSEDEGRDIVEEDIDGDDDEMDDEEEEEEVVLPLKKSKGGRQENKSLPPFSGPKPGHKKGPYNQNANQGNKGGFGHGGQKGQRFQGKKH